MSLTRRLTPRSKDGRLCCSLAPPRQVGVWKRPSAPAQSTLVAAESLRALTSNAYEPWDFWFAKVPRSRLSAQHCSRYINAEAIEWLTVGGTGAT